VTNNGGGMWEMRWIVLTHLHNAPSLFDLPQKYIFEIADNAIAYGRTFLKT